MASTQTKITFVYSRQMNGLAELQQWWPCYIINDGVGGLTVDPVLFRSTFGPLTIEDEGRGLMDESNTVGVRVEALNTDGSQVSGSPTIQIVDSGTLNARCIITHPDGTATEWRFVAPSGDVKNAIGYGTYITDGAGATEYGGTVSSPDWTYSAGPYPVFATIQDFAEFVDGATNQAADALIGETLYKYAWMPHGLITPSTSGNPAPQDDPRLDAASDDAMPDPSPYRATVFMPLMLDNNQLADIQSPACSNDIIKGEWDGSTVEDGTGNSGAYFNFYDEGLTRYSQQPPTGAFPRAKRLGRSGDSLVGQVGSFPDRDMTNHAASAWNYVNPDNSPDSSAYGGPSYRMRTALACFLKDGTYTLNNGGSLIPYIYDPTRSIGGQNTNTCYAVWNGEAGLACTTAQLANVETDVMTSAQIWPLSEFVQGPFCPPSQGSNFSAEHGGSNTYNNWVYFTEQNVAAQAKVTAGTWSGDPMVPPRWASPRRQLVRPNPIRAPIYAAEQVGTASDPNNYAGTINIWVEDNSGSRPNNDWVAGMPMYLKLEGAMDGSKDVDGNYLSTWCIGYNRLADGAEADLQIYNTGTTAEGYYYPTRGGWWITSEVATLTSVAKSTIVSGATGTFTGHKLTFFINSKDTNLNDIAPYELSPLGYVCQGLMGGAEVRFADETSGGVGMAEPENAMNNYQIWPSNRFREQGLSCFGIGFLGGLNQGANVVSLSGHQAFTPTRADLSPASVWYADYGGYLEDDKYAPRGISIVSANDARYVQQPTVQGLGGGTLRLPAPPCQGNASMYYSPTIQTGMTSGTAVVYGDFGHGYTTSPTDSTWSRYQLSARWLRKTLHVPMLSYMDNSTGKHSWDDGWKPPNWTWGRNRPWPVHERCGTQIGYGPLSSINQWTMNIGATTVGDREPPCEETTKTGLTEIGCSPVWLDMTLRGFIPVRDNRMTIIEFDTGESQQFYGRHAMQSQQSGSGIADRSGFTPLTDGSNQKQQWVGWLSTAIDSGYLSSGHRSNTELWMWGGASMFAGTAFDAAGWTDVRADPAGGWVFGAIGSNNGGWGNMGNGYGTGASFTISEGYHTIRTTFDEEGMTLQIDDTQIGKDLNVNNPVWGLQIHGANASASAYRDAASPIKDALNFNLFPSGMAYQKAVADLQIDELVLRHIPSLPMTPFPVDTITQQIAGVGKYTALTVECDNISPAKKMNVKCSICPVVANTGNPRAGGTPYTDFDNIDLGIVGGYGSMDLSGLPTDAITNGFVIRFLFYVPTASDTTLHPVDWRTTPIVRSWTIEYDLAPTATLACIGNTYNGDITTPIDTKVGHIVSFRGTGTTTDIDRLVSAVKFDFGDGVQTDWLLFTDQSTQSNTFDTAHSYLTTGTYAPTVYVKDDAGNTTESSALSVVVVNAAPVAVLRAIPSLVRAGDVVDLDGSGSFDINSGGSISTYTFTFGDGSLSVSGGAPTVQHTYATAGEYQSTLVVVDADGQSSAMGSTVIKVIPATLVVPLVFNTRPRAFSRTRSADYGQTPVLDAVYPELTDTGQRHDEFTLSGLFLKETANADIDFCEELLLSGALVSFEWEDVNFAGTPTGRTFVGRITSFDYEREGGQHGQTPYNLMIIREAGLGV